MERGEPPAANSRGPLAELCRRIVEDLTTATRSAEVTA